MQLYRCFNAVRAAAFGSLSDGQGRSRAVCLAFSAKHAARLLLWPSDNELGGRRPDSIEAALELRWSCVGAALEQRWSAQVAPHLAGGYGGGGWCGCRAHFS